ncbi:MAG: hypothetical protein ACJAZB_000151 [Psychrosphaera sp.]|jgi:hypothetical protein
MNTRPNDILICGGGTAGWMAANLFMHNWPDASVTLIESDNIGIIGVGEGSTPSLKQFFKTLGISDQEWMPQCNATYKVGIRFPHWSDKQGYESYFHPFFSELDIKPGEPFFHNSKLQRKGVQANAHPDHYFVTAQMARQKTSPISNKYPNLDIDYGYHFDSGLLGEFLKKRAILNGLNHIIDDISHIEVDQQGLDAFIKYVEANNSGKHKADLFVDCTGFKSLLMQNALKVEFKHYKENLFNDSAVAIATDIDISEGITPETRSTALKYGWAWQIPLANRYGNGYVYSSDYVSSEEAEKELKEHLGITDDNVKVRHLKMKVGRLQQHSVSNCLAVGLSQGFIEPLEATALMLVQYTIEQYISTVDQPNENDKYTVFNNKVNNMMEGIRDYIVAHYVLNSRNDTDYWRDCRNAKKSETLTELLAAWNGDGNFEDMLDRLDNYLVYLRPSWYVILMGMGHFSTPNNIQPTELNKVFDYTKSRNYCGQLVDDVFPDHVSTLKGMYKDKWPS